MVKRALGFRIGRFDHEAVAQRPVHRRRMNVIVNHPLGDVVERDTFPQQAVRHSDELVSTEAALLGVEIGHLVVIAQSGSQVIRAEHSFLRHVAQPIGPAGGDIRPAPHQHAELTGKATHLADGFWTVTIEIERTVLGHHHLGRRQIRSELVADGDRSGPGPAAPVGRREGLVRVEVHHIGAELPRAGLAKDRVHVGAVEIEQGPGVVHDVGRLADLGVEQPGGVGVGDHERRNGVRSVLIDESAKVIQVGVPVRRLHRDRVAGAHRATCRVRAVGAVGHEHNVALGLADIFEIRPDDLQRGVLAVRTRGRLERHFLKSGDLLEEAPRFVQQPQRPLDLFVVLERMELCKSIQCRRPLVDPRIVLHRARPERIEVAID